MFEIDYRNKATRKRILQVIEWVEKYIGADTKCLTTSILRSSTSFGNSDLGRYLKDLLLIKRNPSYKPGEFSQQYSVNILHLNRLRSRMGLAESQLKYTNIEQRFESQKTQIESGQFDYNESGGRWYNGLQNIPRHLKETHWADRGYCYDYDIESCAPTLLLQRYYQLDPQAPQLDYIKFLLDNKQEVRTELSIQTGLGMKQIKQVINAIFLGGQLQHHRDNKILHILNHNHRHMQNLISNDFIKELRSDITKLWKVLGQDIDRGHSYTSLGVRRRNKITGKHKTDYYKILEGQVMKVIWKYIGRTYKRSVRVFREHDGFRSTEFITPDELAREVRQHTGYLIQLTWNKISI